MSSVSLMAAAMVRNERWSWGYGSVLECLPGMGSIPSATEKNCLNRPKRMTDKMRV
jgi:hypothetical protein